MKTWLKKYYPLITILIPATAFRFVSLLNRGTLTFDETFSVHYSSLPWHEFIKYAILETNPPFFTLFLRYWLKLVGQNDDILARLPSVVFSLLAIILIYFFASKKLSRRSAIVAGILLSFSDIFFFLSGEARSYTLIVLLSILSFWLFQKIYIELDRHKLNWIAYWLVNLILIYTHLTTLFVPFVQFLSLIFFKTDKKNWLKWWGLHLSIGLLWLPWLIPSIFSKLNQNTLTAWYFNSGGNGETNFLTLFNSFFFTMNSNAFSFTIFSLIAIIGSIFIYQKIKTTPDGADRNFLVMLTLWVAVPIFFPAFIGIFLVKFSLIAIPAIFMLTGYILDKKLLGKKYIWTIIFIVSFLSPGILNLASSHIYSITEIINTIEKREDANSLIVVIPFPQTLGVERYYHGQSEIVGVYPKPNNLDQDEKIVRFNWNKLITTREELEQWLLKTVNNKNKIYLLRFDDAISSEDFSVIDMLKDHGYKLNFKQRAVGFSEFYLFEFYAPNYNPATSTINAE